MTDLVPAAFFIGCLLITFGLVRLCDWLSPHAGHSEPGRVGPRYAEKLP